MKNIKKHMEEVYGLEKEQVEKIIKTAISSIENLISSAEEALNKGNEEEVLRSIHTIKTNFLSMGLNELGKLAQQIEKNIKTNKNIKIDEFLQDIKTKWLDITKKN